MKKTTMRTCSKGHLFTRSSACPTCPICEQERKPKDSFLFYISAPARRALEREGIETVDQLSTLTVHEVLQLHGIGPSSIPKLKKSLSDSGLAFRILEEDCKEK